MRYTHYLLVIIVVGLWVTSLMMLIVGSVTDEGHWALPWSEWLLGPAVVVSLWLLLWDHRTRAPERLEVGLRAEGAGVERLASAVALAMVQDRTTPIR